MLKKSLWFLVSVGALTMYSCGDTKTTEPTVTPDPIKGLALGIDGEKLPEGAVIVLGKDLTISDITQTDAKATAKLVAVDAKDPIIEHGFIATAVGTTNSVTAKANAISTVGNATIMLNGLTEDTEYDVKFYVKTAKGTANHANTVKFRTLKKTIQPPTVVYYSQRVLIEEFTGAWCGWCPRGIYTMNTLVNQNKGLVIGAAIHSGDAMENQILFKSLNTTYSVPGFPSGMVNRKNNGGYVIGDDEWEKATKTILAKNNSNTTKPELGIAIETSLESGMLKGKVKVAFNEKKSTTGYKLVLYLLEDGIKDIAQRNYLSGNADYKDLPYYSMKDPIADFVHNHVVRKPLTDSKGEDVPAEFVKAGGVFEYSFDSDLTRYVPANCSIVAFVTDGSSKPYIINVQEVKAGEKADY